VIALVATINADLAVVGMDIKMDEVKLSITNGASVAEIIQNLDENKVQQDLRQLQPRYHGRPDPGTNPGVSSPATSTGPRYNGASSTTSSRYENGPRYFGTGPTPANGAGPRQYAARPYGYARPYGFGNGYGKGKGKGESSMNCSCVLKCCNKNSNLLCFPQEKARGRHLSQPHPPRCHSN
jgi:hypothetical protein